jgi:hypothetical protein
MKRLPKRAMALYQSQSEAKREMGKGSQNPDTQKVGVLGLITCSNKSEPNRSKTCGSYIFK